MRYLIEGAGAFAVGVIAWFATSFVAQPIRRFFDLRGEVIHKLAKYANVKARWKEVRDELGAGIDVKETDASRTELERLDEAKDEIRDLASRMKSFAENETLATRALRVVGYDAAKASAGLFGLSNEIDTYGGTKAFQKKTIEHALRLRDV